MQNKRVIDYVNVGKYLLRWEGLKINKVDRDLYGLVGECESVKVCVCVCVCKCYVFLFYKKKSIIIFFGLLFMHYWLSS